MVRLLRFRFEGQNAIQRSFNPTMVRLLPKTFKKKALTQTCFNPTMVRLLRGYCAIGAIGYVSIPQWCDCCTARLDLTRMCVIRFNPTMVRLLRLEYNSLFWEFARFNPTMVRLLPRQNFGV